MNDVNKVLESFESMKESMTDAAGCAIPVTRIDDYEVFLVAFRIPEKDRDKMASTLIKSNVS